MLVYHRVHLLPHGPVGSLVLAAAASSPHPGRNEDDTSRHYCTDHALHVGHAGLLSVILTVLQSSQFWPIRARTTCSPHNCWLAI